METSEKKRNKIQLCVAKRAHKLPSDYSLTVGDLNELFNASQKDIFEALIIAYDYGLIRGTRAKARGRVPVL